MLLSNVVWLFIAVRAREWASFAIGRSETRIKITLLIVLVAVTIVSLAFLLSAVVICE